MTEPVDTLPASPGDEKWLGGRKWTGLAAVIILGVLLVAAGGVLFSDNGDGQQPPPATAPTATVHTKPGGVQDQSLPTSAPANVTWSLFEGFGLPVSADAGPADVQGSVASRYSHSPTGALIAAAQLSMRVMLAPDTDWQRTVEAGTVPGKGREAWVKKRKSLHFGSNDPGRFAQFAGFQFVGYSPELAVINLVTGDATRGYQSGTVTLVWRDSDWKVQQGPDGLTSTTVHPISDMSGFVPWFFMLVLFPGSAGAQRQQSHARDFSGDDAFAPGLGGKHRAAA